MMASAEKNSRAAVFCRVGDERRDFLEEREQLLQAMAAQEALRGTLPDEVVEATVRALREKLAALDTAAQRQQRKLATILFADVAGFTAMSETLDPEIVTGIMNDLWARLDAVIVDQGGHIDKHIGDAVMAIWGAETAREDDPERAVRAALAMQQELGAFSAAGGEPLQLSMRVGINTGPVLLGQVGSTHEFTAMGDAVNLASRLEHAAPPGGILISHDTYRHVRGLFDVQALAPIQIKGKTEPVQVYIVQQAKPRAFQVTTRGVEGVETRMIGREAEMLALQSAFHDVVEGFETRVETVIGEPGVGKSRLLYEFNHWLDDQPQQVTLMSGRATPTTERVANGLFYDLFASRFGIREADSTAVALGKFRAGTDGILSKGEADVMGHWLGFDFSVSEAVDKLLGSQDFNTIAQGHVAHYMRAKATNKPVVLLLEDLHWADNGSLTLIQHLAKVVDEQAESSARLLIIGMTRPVFFERRPHWGEGEAPFRRISLAPLSRRASNTLVDEILQRVADIPNALRDFVVESAEGNPFYVEELIKMLIDQGVIETSASYWRVRSDRLAETEVPSTLTGLLQARLDVLPTMEREILQRASVIGRLFWDTAVADLAERNVEEIQSLLGAVRRRELIFQREHSTFADTEEYIFKHALLRDVVYETVLLKERRDYHHRAARWLEANAGERQKEYLDQIAAHYMLADEREKALPYLLQAGDEARFRNAFEEAARFYEQALEIYKKAGDYELAVRVLMKLGLTYNGAFDFERSRQAYDESFALQQQVQTDSTPAQLPPAPHPLRVPSIPPSSLDPTRTERGEIVTDLFSGLVRLTPEMDLVPDIAASWQIENEGRTYIFHLRDDVRWSDGHPVKAGDFVYAWRRALDPENGSPVATILHDIKGAAPQRDQEWDPEQLAASAPDARTLRVELHQPVSYFLQVLVHGVTMPVPQHVVEAHGEAWTDGDNFVSNGCFLLDSWRKGESLVLRRNPGYHGPFRGNVKKVVLYFDRDAKRLLPLYAGGEIDILWLTTLSADELRRIAQRYADDYINLIGNRTGYVGFNVNQPPFDDPRVRRAFVLAADRTFLAEDRELDRASPVTGGFIPPGLPGHAPNIALPFDVDAAQRLLAESGYPGGQDLPPLKALLLPWDTSRVGEYILDPWESRLGVTINREYVSWDVYWDQIREEQPHFYAYGWQSVYRDPDSYLRVGMQNASDWQNPTYYDLVERARHSMDHQERMRLYRQAEEILAEQAPIMPLLYLHDPILIKPWIRNYPLRDDLSFKSWFDVVIIDPHE